MHGKTRRGALVFDVADLIKDALVLPWAFISARYNHKDRDFRQRCLLAFTKHKALDFMFNQVKQDALFDCNKAIELDSNDLGFWRVRGVVKFELGDTEGAMNDFNRGLEIDPKNPGIYYDRGVLKAKMGNFDGALSDFNEAIKMDSNYFMALRARASVKCELGDLQGGKEDLQKALKIVPDDPVAKDMLDRLLKEERDI